MGSDLPPHSIHVSDIEQALNYLRKKHPSPDGISLAKPLRKLGEIYGLMAYYREVAVDAQTMPQAAYKAWLEWYDTTLDTPCIAICSTSQGDAICKGCGRSFEEVQEWQAMSPAQKRQTWYRINNERTAWRYNRYQERAQDVMQGQVGLFDSAGVNNNASESDSSNPEADVFLDDNSNGVAEKTE